MPETKWLVVAVTTVLVACIAGVALALLSVSFRYERARQLWQERRPAHYEIEYTWASGWSFGHVQVEVRDGQVIRGTNVENGQPLARYQLQTAGYYATIDNLFNTIAYQLRPPPTLLGQIARYHPLLAEQIDRCAALLPQISYDAEYGFPNAISYRGTPCFDGGNLSLRVTDFHPLP